jgi:hypothetical protein
MEKKLIPPPSVVFPILYSIATLLIWMTVFTFPVNSAQLLVQAKDSPFPDGAKKGDIIVVRGDEWVWGTEECLPNYVVVKLPGVPVSEASKYEEPLTEEVQVERAGKMETESKVVRARKHSVPVADVDALITARSSVKAVLSKDVSAYPIATKTLAVEKAVVAEEMMEMQVE